LKQEQRWLQTAAAKIYTKQAKGRFKDHPWGYSIRKKKDQKNIPLI
jgi:hypothetical protein